MKPVQAFTLAASLGLASAAMAETTLLTDVTVVNVETGQLSVPTSVLMRDGLLAEIHVDGHRADRGFRVGRCDVERDAGRQTRSAVPCPDSVD